MVMCGNSIKRVKVIIITIIIFMLAFIVFVFISPFIMFNIENRLLADELNNPYINTDYSGWQSLYIKDFGNIMIPNKWTISQATDENIYHIEDNTIDGIIARAVVLSGNNSFYEFLSSDMGIESSDILTEYETDFISIEGSSFYKCTIRPTEQSYISHFLQTMDWNTMN